MRSVAPMDSSIPRARSRRCASTVNPPTDTSAISSMPTVASASTMVSGLIGLLLPMRARRRDVRPDTARVHARCVEEDVHRGRVRHLPRGDQRELVEQALRVLHDADDRLAALGPGVAHAEVELGRHARGEGDLVRPGRVVPGEQLEHRPAVGAVRVLGPKLVRLGAAGDVERLVLDDLDRAEAVLQRGDLGVHRVQVEIGRSARVPECS